MWNRYVEKQQKWIFNGLTNEEFLQIYKGFI